MPCSKEKQKKGKYRSSYQGQKTIWHLLENSNVFDTFPLGAIPLINYEVLDNGMAKGFLLVVCMSLDKLFMLLKTGNQETAGLTFMSRSPSRKAPVLMSHSTAAATS